MNPYKQRSIIIACICIFALCISLFSNRRDDLFFCSWFLAVGIITALCFRWQCIYSVEQNGKGGGK